MNHLLKKTIAYVVSFSLTIVVLVYLLDLPKYISEQPKIVDLYLHKYLLKTLMYEMIIIAVYIGITELLIKVFKVKENYKKLLLVNAVTAILSGIFVLLYKYVPHSSTIFNRWFKATGWTYVLYEVILVGTIYHVYEHLVHHF
jgi:hypothetical protein